MKENYFTIISAIILRYLKMDPYNPYEELPDGINIWYQGDEEFKIQSTGHNKPTSGVCEAQEASVVERSLLLSHL